MTVLYDRVYLNLRNAMAQHAVCKRFEQKQVILIVILEIMEELLAILGGETRR